MTLSLTEFDARLAPLRAFEGVDVAGVARRELVELMRLAAQLKSAADMVVAEVSGEVARRSSVDDGPGGLARQEGFASPEHFVASVTGGAFGQGKQLVAAGRALAENRPAAEGLRNGTLSVAKVELIASTIAALEGDTTELEAKLTAAARRLDYRRLQMVCRNEAARFDAAQLENKERRQHASRKLEVYTDGAGMTQIHGQLPPPLGVFVATFMDAQVKAAFQAKSDADGTGIRDDRTVDQIRADALVALATHGLDCESKATGVKAVVIVRIDEKDLYADAGVGTCDALRAPISLNALRQIAVDAAILPMVMNGKGQVLDMGREERLFSWAQRMALAERDGGCAKCHAPISHCITHHIRWWSEDGLTDLRNGVLLCVRCHTQIHHDHWDIRVDADNRVWFTPPPDIDPQQRRILGGLAALTG